MRFDSLTFFVFLVVVVFLHHALPWRVGRVVLLVASYLFYGATELWYVLLLFISTYVDYLVALALGKQSSPLKRRALVCISIATNMGMLAFFKYTPFAISNLNLVSPWPLPVPTWMLPIGISFYSFQTLAYSIDVYRRRIEPERDFITFALFVSFFPQLVAGPIERARHLLPQLRSKQPVSGDDITYGVQRILIGMFKKIVLADRLAFAVDPFYARIGTASATDLVLATISFSFRLYLDFSGYTDIAIGLARLVGVRLSENFNRPFLCRDVTDFWARWHMTLTAWFRDYVHTSMRGLKRGRPWRNALTTIITMTLVGVWHGAAWNYVCFGFLAGVELAAYHALRLRPGRKSVGPLFGYGRLGTLTAIALAFCEINVTMASFRAPSLAAFFTVVASPLTRPWTTPAVAHIIYLPLFVAILAWEAFAEAGKPIRLKCFEAPALRGFVWTMMLLAVIFASVDHSEEFIYFRF